MERQGPLYDAIRDVLKRIDERRDDHVKRLRKLEQSTHEHPDGLIGDNQRAHDAFDERLKAIEERLTVLAKAKARPVKPAAKPATKAKGGSRV